MSNTLKLSVVAGLAVTLVVACTGFMGGAGIYDAMRTLPEPVRVVADTIPCEGLPTLLECAVVTERIQIARAGGLVRRDPSGICFEGTGIASLCVAGDAPGPPAQRRFYVGSTRDPALHLFYIHPEGSGLLAVGARRGKQTPVDDIPRGSPEGNFIAVSALNLGSGVGPNRFRVHQLQNDSFPVVFEVEPEGWGPGRPRWISADRVRFPMIRPSTVNVPENRIADSVTVILNEGVWILIPPSTR